MRENEDNDFVAKSIMYYVSTYCIYWCQIYVCIKRQLQLDWTPGARTRNINLPSKQKGYSEFETTYEKLSARRIQIFRVYYFCVIQSSPLFKITFKIMPKQK